MRFILPNNLKFVKRFIEQTFFGAIKVHGANTIQDRFIVETVFVDANQYLWCFCGEDLPVTSDKFEVTVKYVDKEKGIFMKVNGMAQLVQPDMVPESDVAIDHLVDEVTNPQKLSLLKVKMTETVYYKKHNGQVDFFAVAS